MILITGHPRTGTGYMAALAQACGLDVQHEAMGRDGISSWMMGPPVWRVPFHRLWEHRGRNWYSFERAFEVVRDPLAMISSVAFTENIGGGEQTTSLWWRAMWTPIDLSEGADPVRQAVVSVVGWHRMMREWLPASQMIRLEEAVVTFPRAMGLPTPANTPGVVNAREHANLTWADVQARCSAEEWRDLTHYRQEIGYD